MPLVNLIAQSLESRLNSYHRIDKSLLKECLIGLPAYTNCLVSAINKNTLACESTYFIPQGGKFTEELLADVIAGNYLIELIFFETHIQDIPVFGIGGVKGFKLKFSNEISPFCALVGKEITHSFLFKDYIVSNTLDKASVFILRELYQSNPDAFNQLEEHFSNERLVKILNHIHTNMEEEVSLQQLADLAALSVDYISQFFKRCVGYSIQFYLIDQRVKRGLEYLVTTRLPISGIAEKAGFIDQAYFNRRFKTCYNVNPLRLRKKYQLLSISQAGQWMASAK
ncbi:MAG: AraC family transcriptional regulator [Bacteroidota bacterium]|nr:AraC family transcriptional regulator [Bacteroidota bacterium]